MKNISFTSGLVFIIILLRGGALAQGWFPLNAILRGVEAIDVNTMIAVGEMGTVLKTTDGGTIWEVQQSGVTTALNKVAFIEGDVGVAVGDEGTIIRTTNGGRTWTPLSSSVTSSLQGVVYAGENTFVVAGLLGVILRSVDGGLTWTARTSGTTQGLHGVFFTSPDTGIVVGDAGTILLTIDGGITWTAQTIGTSEDLRGCVFHDASRGVVVGNSGVIGRTTDGGTTWTLQPSGVSGTLRTVSFASDDTLITVGGDFGQFGIPGPPIILRSTDGGVSWTEVIQSAASYLLAAVSFGRPGSGTAVGAAGEVIRTTDFGLTWTRQAGGTVESLWGVSFINTDIGLATAENFVYRTTNGGQSWTRHSGPTGQLLDVSLVNSSIGFVPAYAYGSGVYKTTDGGQTWSVSLGGDWFNGISFVDENTGTALDSFYGAIYGTTDGGQTWQLQLDYGLGNSLEGVSFTEPNTGTIVGWSTLGGNLRAIILHTTDGGLSWIEQGDGIAGFLRDVSFIDNNTGTCVGHGGMVLHTTDGGITWVEQTSGTSVDLIGVSFVDANIGVAVGSSGTIVRTTNGGQVWSVQSSGTTANLTDVNLIDANIGTVVGSDGTILRTTTGGTGINPPETPALLSPPNGAIEIPRTPVLSWSSVPGAQWYTLQLGLDPYFRTVVLNQTRISLNSYQVDSLQPESTYHWRVSMTDITGTSNWSETWGFTTTTDSVPNQTALVSPGDGAIVTADSLVFVWHQSAPDVDRYWLEGSTDSLFTMSFVDSLVTDTTQTVTLLNHNQTYWWRVRAHNSYGWGEFSEARDFFVFLEVPASPILLSPSNGATDVSTNPTLGWNPSLGAESYTLQVSDTSDFSRFVLNQDSISALSFDVPGLSNNVTYYWRVSATNDLGTSDWSEVWSFMTIVALPAQVSLVQPESGAVISTDSATFVWQQSQPEIDRYWFELITPKGSQIDSAVNDTSTIVYGLVNGAIYFWKVRAHNAAGWGAFSETWEFTVLISGVKDRNEIPTEFSLSQNYPNPFNPTTTIRYALSENAQVTLKVYNMLGQLVATIVDEPQTAGYKSVVWNGASSSEVAVSSGIYIYTIVAGSFTSTKRMLLLK